METPTGLNILDCTFLEELTHLRIKQDLEVDPLPEELALIPSHNLESIEIKAVKISYEKVVNKLLHIVDQLASHNAVVTVRTE